MKSCNVFKSARASVSLSLDAETLAIWNQIPLKQRSAMVRDYLRAVSREGNLEATYSVLEPRALLKNIDSKSESHKPRAPQSVLGRISVAEMLSNIP